MAGGNGRMVQAIEWADGRSPTYVDGSAGVSEILGQDQEPLALTKPLRGL